MSADQEFTDAPLLKALARQPGAPTLQPVVERYLPFVFSSALRRTGNSEDATEVTRAVFQVLTRRARHLGKKTVLGEWLFHVTAVAARKLKRRNCTSAWRWLGWFRRTPTTNPPLDAPLWDRAAPHLDAIVDRLSTRQRRAMLLVSFLNLDSPTAAAVLQTKEQRVRKRAVRALRKVSRLLHKRRITVEPEQLAQLCSQQACAAPIPDGLLTAVLATADEQKCRRPAPGLARRTLSSLAWARWRHRASIGIPGAVGVLLLVGWGLWHLDSLTGHSHSIALFFEWSVRNQARSVPGLAQEAKPWPGSKPTTRLDARAIKNPENFYQTTNIWLAHLKFSWTQWMGLEPERIGPLPHFFQPDGTVLLRNPKAQRSGLAGVLGYDFNWTHADLELSGAGFTNVAARFKGNGTYISSLYSIKRAFKLDLNKFAKGQKLGGVDELNFHNLVEDRSYLSDTLGYEFFRDAGVPAPRTTFAWLDVTVQGKWNRKPLGLYLVVEAIDEEFAEEWFGTKKTPIFKPVTHDLFKHLGDDWSAYAAIYDLKTRATPEQERRIMDFSDLVSNADDTRFAERLPEFLDLEEFAGFLAGEVLIATYDSFLSTGQNFFFYIDPKSNRIGFIPWDLDHAWGGFYLLGSRKDFERASIWRPWVGKHRLLERVMAVEAFRKVYRARLDDLCTRLLIPERLGARIDELAAIVRDPIAAESDYRLDKFEQAVGAKPAVVSEGQSSHGPTRRVLELKRFIEARAKSVRSQLDGTIEGKVIGRSNGR